MSGVDWGIVIGLVAMVGTLLMCFRLLHSSNVSGATPGSDDEADDPHKAVRPTPGGYHRAA